MNEQESTQASLRKLIEDLTLLIESSSVLAGSLKLENVLPRTLDLCRSLITADSYAVWLHDQLTRKWSIVTSAGLSAEYQRLTFLNLDHSTPMLSQPLVIEDVAQSPFLDTHRQLQRTEGICSLLVVPLKISGANSGTLVFYYKSPHRFTSSEVRIGVGIGNLVGATLTSIRICENEAALRHQAEKARQRAAFLAELSTVLSQSLDLQTTLEKVVRLAVSNVAQSCTIHLRDEAGNFIMVATAHEDPELDAVQQQTARAYRPELNPNSKIVQAYESRRRNCAQTMRTRRRRSVL